MFILRSLLSVSFHWKNDVVRFNGGEGDLTLPPRPPRNVVFYATAEVVCDAKCYFADGVSLAALVEPGGVRRMACCTTRDTVEMWRLLSFCFQSWEKRRAFRCRDE